MHFRSWLAGLQHARWSVFHQQPPRPRQQRVLGNLAADVRLLEQRRMLSASTPDPLDALLAGNMARWVAVPSQTYSLHQQAGSTAGQVAAEYHGPAALSQNLLSHLRDAGDQIRSRTQTVSVDRITNEFVVRLQGAVPAGLQSSPGADGWEILGTLGQQTLHVRWNGTTPADPTTLGASLRARTSSSRAAPQVAWQAPVLFDAQLGRRVFLSNELIVSLRPDQRPERVFTQAAGFAGYQRLLGTPNQYVATIAGDGLRALQLSNQMQGSAQVEFATPNAWYEMKLESTTNDPQLSQAWHLNNTGQQGAKVDADADVAEAWNQETGSASVVIAVLDDGIDLTHPDLVDNLFINSGEIANNSIDDDGNGWIDDWTGLDFSSLTTGVYDADPSHSSIADGHGTATAGIAAATGNNSLGVTGVAQHSKILPVKIWVSQTRDPLTFTINAANLASAVYYAAGRTADGLSTWRGADIQSQSFTGTGGIPAVDAAYNWAASSARGGLGQAIFAAAGNKATGYGEVVIPTTQQSASTWSWVISYKKDAATTAGEDAIRLGQFIDSTGTVYRFDSLTPPAGFNLNPFEGQAGWVMEDDPAHAFGTSRYQLRSSSIGNSAEAFLMTPAFTTGPGPIVPGIRFQTWISSDTSDSLGIYLWDHNSSTLIPMANVAGANPSTTSTIGFPANLSSTIAVGASTDFDYRAAYSQYGVGLDVVAPSSGGFAGIVTTDRQGTSGFNGADTASGGDFATIGGTSAATPQAAGVAALMLSINPSLTAAQIRQILHESADKIGGVTYTAGFNEYYGYGRINAAAAVDLAAPTILTLSAQTITENQPLGTAIGTFDVTDAVNPGSLIYTLVSGPGSADNPSFQIVGNQLRSNVMFDYESKSSYSIRVRVTDGADLTFEKSFAISIHNGNDAPTMNDAVFSMSENRPLGYLVGTVAGTDLDVGQTLSYLITAGNTNNAFTINATTGQIRVNSVAPINYELNPSFTLTIQATDNGTPQALSTTATVVINLMDLNEAPFFLAPVTFSIAENRPVGTVVGDVNAMDPDAGQTLTYRLVGGDENSQFAIDAATGVITVAQSTIDYEAKSQYLLQVLVEDNGSPRQSRTQTITVNIQNVNEAPTIAPQTFAVAENSAAATVVGTVLALDPEGQAVTYSITGGNTNGAFAINAATGQLTVANAAALNFEATPQFVLQVKVQDGGFPAQSRTQTITINLLNLNEAPSIAPQTLIVTENSAVGTVVGTVLATDPDAGQTLTYSITGGNTNGGFAINATSGQLTVANSAALNFATTPQFLLSVLVQDNGSPTLNQTQTITINLTKINRPPVVNPQTFSRPENSTVGTVVGTVLATDPDAGQTLTYSITGGNTNNAFAINAATGQLSVANAAALNFEVTPQFLLSVKVQDNGSPVMNQTQTITVNLSNVNEAPMVANQNFGLKTRSAAGKVVGTIVSSDPDVGQSRTFAIVSGNTNNAFAVNATTGQITVLTTNAVKRAGTFKLVVRVTDNGSPSLFTDATMTIKVSLLGSAKISDQEIAKEQAADATFQIALPQETLSPKRKSPVPVPR